VRTIGPPLARLQRRAAGADAGSVTPGPDPVSRLYEIAAFERPLTPAERLAAGLESRLDPAHVASLWEQAAFERPLDEGERLEVELDLARRRAA